MGFLNPGLLWFALGGAIPILIHLLHRQKYRRVRWAAMELLRLALRRTQRRLRIENLLLLLVRILVMALLAFAIARPFFHEAPLAALQDSDTHHVFVMDLSYSMSYKRAQDTSLDVAKKAAVEFLNGIREGEADRFTLLPLTSYPEAVLKYRNRKDLIRTAINDLEPSDYGTSLCLTLLELRNLLDSAEAPKNREKRVYIFTDLQRVGWVPHDDAEVRRLSEILKELSQRKDVMFTLFDAGTPDPVNRAVVDLRVEGDAVTTRRTTRLTADIHNYSPNPFPNLAVSLYVDDALVETKQVVLPPDATASAGFEYSFTQSGSHIVKVTLDPDFLDVDDRRWLALEVKDALRGLVIDGEPGDSRYEGEAFTFLLALDPTGEGLYFSTVVKTLELFSAGGLEAYDFLVLANVSGLTPDKVEKVEEFVRRGGGLFVALGKRVDRLSYNEFLWNQGKGMLPAPLDEPVGDLPGAGLQQGTERRIGRFEISHPVFSAFREKLRAALHELVFFRYFKVHGFDPRSVLASFDDDTGSPILLEKAFGEGKVLLFTTTIDHEWNAGIPGKPPYLPLLWRICEYLATRPAGKRNFFVGDLLHVDLPVEHYQPPITLETPSQGTVTLPTSAPEQGLRFFRVFYPQRARTDDPKLLKNEGLQFAGKYVLAKQNPREEDRLLMYFAANVPPRAPSPEEIHAAEGNLDRIPKEEIRQRYPEFKVEFRGDRKEGREIALAPSAGGSLWKVLLYLVLGFMLVESVLAWLFGRAKH